MKLNLKHNPMAIKKIALKDARTAGKGKGKGKVTNDELLDVLDKQSDILEMILDKLQGKGV